jgi:hypothetical protein
LQCTAKTLDCCLWEHSVAEKESLYNPQDVAGKVFLLEVELARVMDKKDLAWYKFVCPIAVTSDRGIVLEQSCHGM